MEKIESFTVNHELLKRDLYVSRKDYDNEGEVPGADPMSCGNYLDQNLPMAKYEANKFYKEVLLNIKDENLIYPN